MSEKIVTYNINGIRAAIRKRIDLWVKDFNPDILCLQEIKANPEQFNMELFNSLGYQCYIHSAQKPGYSGVAIISKVSPNHIEYGCGIKEIDCEGRIMRADYDNFSVMSVYFPSGSSGENRQNFKMIFLDKFQKYINKLTRKLPHLIISGDYNICHRAIDIHNPQRNKNTSGFLIEERDWVSQLIESGFIDTFRYINKDPHHYSWWSYRSNARMKNLGWRIDYHMISSLLEDKIINAYLLPNVMHSDHCPVVLEIEN